MQCPFTAATVRMGRVSSRASTWEQNRSMRRGREEGAVVDANHSRSNPLQKNLGSDNDDDDDDGCGLTLVVSALLLEGGGDNPVIIKLL